MDEFDWLDFSDDDIDNEAEARNALYEPGIGAEHGDWSHLPKYTGPKNYVDSDFDNPWLPRGDEDYF